MRLTRRKDGPIKRSKRGGRGRGHSRGRGDLQSFKSVRKFLQRGGAVGDISFTLAKLDFLLSIYETKQGVLTILNRFKKVLELGGLIKNKTVTDLEDYNSRLNEPVVFDVNTSEGLDRVRTKLFIDNMIATPDPAGEESISINKDNTGEFEDTVNYVAMVMNDLFQILLVGSEPSTKRKNFLTQFKESTYLSVDSSVDDISEFILDGTTLIDLSSSVLEYFNGIIEERVKKNLTEQTYYMLEVRMFLALLKADKRLLSYFSIYRNKLKLSTVGKISDIIQEKINGEELDGFIDKTQSESTIIENLFNHVSGANTKEIKKITFVVGINGIGITDTEFINKMKAKEQKLSILDLLINPDILIKLQPLYSKIIFEAADKTVVLPNDFRPIRYDRTKYKYTSDAGISVDQNSIKSVTFSNPKPAAAAGEGEGEGEGEGAEGLPEIAAPPE